VNKSEMSVEVTLSLPKSLIEYAKYFGNKMQQNIEAVLSDALELTLPMWENISDNNSFSYPSISSLSDAEVLQLADSKMDVVQNRRLGKLQAKGKTVGLSLAERYELFALLKIYQMGQLRKSEGLAESVQRGLRPPLPV
jgi:hypothetical protein